MLNQNLTEAAQLESLKGHRLGPYLSFNPVSATQIWQWCSAMGDKNPSYQPGEDQIAPPAMMQMWTMRNIDDDYAPGSTDAPPYQVFDEMKSMGYPANVAVSYDINFHRYLKIGEQVKHFTTVVNISDKKTTGLGVGFFVTECVEYLTLDEALFAKALITYFQYCPPQSHVEDDSSESRTQRVEPASVEIEMEQLQEPANTWTPDFSNVKSEQVSVGDKLPALIIPVTHKLIVGGAVATQDFIPVHHNVPAARAAGMPDIFMNILTTSGLSARYLSDWAGAQSRLSQIKFNLMAPNFPGDTMIMEGQVTAIERATGGVEVVIAFGGKNTKAYHTQGTATLVLPDQLTKA